MVLKIKQLHPLAVLPKQATTGSAGFDFAACLPEGAITIAPGERALVPTGIALEIPPGHVGLLAIRSSMGVKAGITLSNGVGVIDADYRGQVHVGLVNLSNAAYTVEHAQRIAQLMVVGTPALEVQVTQTLSETERGEGGFGSTGE